MSGPQRVSQSNLRQGAVYLCVGLLWGMLVPATTFPRLAVGAHIQLTAHGVMFLAAGLLIAHLGLGAGKWQARILVAAPWLTWLLMLSEIANAWWGAHNILPVAAQQANAPGAVAWQEGIVTAAHVGGAIVQLVYWLTILRALFITTSTARVPPDASA